jgi:hypothetical protein
VALAVVRSWGPLADHNEIDQKKKCYHLKYIISYKLRAFSNYRYYCPAIIGK